MYFFKYEKNVRSSVLSFGRSDPDPSIVEWVDNYTESQFYRHKLSSKSQKLKENIAGSKNFFIFRLGVTIKDIQQERAWLKNDIFSVQDTVVVETRDSEHAQEMVTELKKNFENLCVTGLNLSGKHS